MSFAGRLNLIYIRYIREHTVKILSWVISFVIGLIFPVLLFYLEPERWQNVITLLAVLASLLIGGLPEFRRWTDRPLIDFDYDRDLDTINEGGKNLHLKITRAPSKYISDLLLVQFQYHLQIQSLFRHYTIVLLHLFYFLV